MRDPFASNFGTRLRHARKAKGLSQTELALRAGTNHVAITRAETGKHAYPAAPVCARLAQALEVPAEWLILGEEKP